MLPWLGFGKTAKGDVKLVTGNFIETLMLLLLDSSTEYYLLDQVQLWLWYHMKLNDACTGNLLELTHRNQGAATPVPHAESVVCSGLEAKYKIMNVK